MPMLNGAHPDGMEIQRAVSKQSAVRELRQLQEVTLARCCDPKASDKSVFDGARTYVDLREQIRIEKGIIKPGSRNISVREGERVMRLPRPTGRTSDYLADARQTLERAQAMSMPDKPVDPPTSP